MTLQWKQGFGPKPSSSSSSTVIVGPPGHFSYSANSWISCLKQSERTCALKVFDNTRQNLIYLKNCCDKEIFSLLDFYLNSRHSSLFKSLTITYLDQIDVLYMDVTCMAQSKSAKKLNSITKKFCVPPYSSMRACVLPPHQVYTNCKLDFIC